MGSVPKNLMKVILMIEGIAEEEEEYDEKEYYTRKRRVSVCVFTKLLPLLPIKICSILLTKFKLASPNLFSCTNVQGERSRVNTLLMRICHSFNFLLTNIMYAYS